MRKTNNNFPEYIIIHHSGGTDANPLEDTSHHTFETIQSWHINGRGWDNIGYHYIIEKSGRVVAGRPENYHGAHAKALNKKSVGIMLSGNFDATLPTKEQEQALGKLLGEVAERHDISVEKMQPHRIHAQKTCYGKKLSDTWGQEIYKKYNPTEQSDHADCVPNTISALVGALISKLNAR